jgi:hypothetical protein
VIVVSTTGKVGSEAARLLAKRSLPVRVLAHHPEKAAAQAEAGVDVVEGDLDVPESIDAAVLSRRRLRLHPVRTWERRISPPVPRDSPPKTRHACSRRCSAGRTASVRTLARNRSRR